MEIFARPRFQRARTPARFALLALLVLLGGINAVHAQGGDRKVDLATLARQEQLLQFDSFDNDTALALGLQVVELARAKGKSVGVNVTRDGTMLFFHGMRGTTADNADWIRRKSNLVNRTGHSSFYTHNEVKNNGGNIDAMPGLDPREYAAQGGSFPLVLKGVGRIGTITVSGLPGEEDHAMVVAALQAYLKVDAGQ